MWLFCWLNSLSDVMMLLFVGFFMIYVVVIRFLCICRLKFGLSMLIYVLILCMFVMGFVWIWIIFVLLMNIMIGWLFFVVCLSMWCNVCVVLIGYV